MGAGTSMGLGELPVKKPELARPGDPYVMVDGTVLQPVLLPTVLPQLKQDTKIDPALFRGKRPRNMADLPAPANMMNAIGAVMLYTFFGVGDREIATALKCSVAELEGIRGHSAYSEFFELISGELISANSDALQNRIAAYQHAALDKVAHIAVYGKREENQLRASVDILDRGGNSPRAIGERATTMKNTLRIQIVKADGNDTDINVTMEQETDGDRS